MTVDSQLTEKGLDTKVLEKKQIASDRRKI